MKSTFVKRLKTLSAAGCFIKAATMKMNPPAIAIRIEFLIVVFDIINTINNITP
jgi:hypothetical protein